MTLPKVHILNLSCLFLYDMIPISTPSSTPATSHPHFPSVHPMQAISCECTKLFYILGPCAYCSLSPGHPTSHFFFFLDRLPSNQSSSITLWMNASFILPVTSSPGRGKNCFLCVPTTAGIYLYYHLSHFIVITIKRVWDPSHYAVNSLEAETILFRCPLGFLGLSLWAPLLQNMLHWQKHTTATTSFCFICKFIQRKIACVCTYF